MPPTPSRTLLFLLTLLVPSLTLAADTFRIEDQFERPHTSASVFSTNRVVIVAGDQRESGESIKTWLDSLEKATSSGVSLYGLVDLDDVPFFVPNAAIRKQIRADTPRTPVLCDWDAEIYPMLGFPENNLVEVAVFDARGKRLGHVRGVLTAKRRDTVVAWLR